MSDWLNNDGLYIRYGQKEVDPQDTGVFGTPTRGGSHIVEMKLDLVDLTTTSAIIDEGVYLPKDYMLEEVQIIADVAATSAGAATLDIGFVRNSDRSTMVDADGAVAELALANINAKGDTTVLRNGDTGAGALVGELVSDTHVTKIVANYGTAAYTAGRLTVRFVLRRI